MIPRNLPDNYEDFIKDKDIAFAYFSHEDSLRDHFDKKDVE